MPHYAASRPIPEILNCRLNSKKVVGSVFPRKQLIEESCLIGCPTGRVKLRHIGIRQRTERGADFRQCLPRNLQVSISCLVADHRVCETTLILKIEADQFQSSLTVCAAKNSSVVRLAVASAPIQRALYNANEAANG